MEHLKLGGYWKVENQRFFFDWLGNQLGYSTKDDWYKVTKEDVLSRGGKKVLSCYNDSPIQALQTVYPEHSWIVWKFNRVPHGYWKKRKNSKDFLDWLRGKLGYKSMEDWYSLTQEDICKNGGRGLLEQHNNSPSKVLQSTYPEHKWKLDKFKNKPMSLLHQNNGKERQKFAVKTMTESANRRFGLRIHVESCEEIF